MNPNDKARAMKLLGPFRHPIRLAYLMASDLRLCEYFPEWYRSFSSKYSLLGRSMPWIPYAAVSWLDDFLRKDMKVFEYGSGGSTLFFARRAGTVFSVEHDRSWHAAVAETLQQLCVRNVEYQLREPIWSTDEGTDSQGAASERVLFVLDPTEALNPGVNFDSYVNTIDAHPDQSLDLVFVDGRARPSCIEHALRKIKNGGYLMLDNSDDPYFVQYCPTISCMEPYENEKTIFRSIAPGWPPTRWTTTLWKISSAHSAPHGVGTSRSEDQLAEASAEHSVH